MRNFVAMIIAVLFLIPLVACNSQETKSNDPEVKQDAKNDEANEVKSEVKKEEAKPVEVEKDVSKRLISFLKAKYGSRLPAQADIQVGDFESTDVSSFDKGSFDITVPGRGEQKVPFLISTDRKFLVIGSSSAVDLNSFTKSTVPGFKQGEIQFGRQQSVPILVSDDGKHLIVGEVLDSTVDPLEEIRDKIALSDVPFKGEENALVTIVEYSDFQCPFCKRGADMLPQILDGYKGKVKVIFKQFPLPNHNWAKSASIASLCSYNQGNEKFWSFHDKVFEIQKEINLENSKDKFKEIASQVGLDSAQFEKCMESPDVAKKVEEDIEEAKSIGVSSTPTFVIDGLVVPGANLQGVKSAIESRLSESS